ncbi:Helix-loop-helix protein 4 [Echinococcus granulosus]|uniref:Basic helix loop helix dimerisation region bHLH n=1 Tax=Echinococcus granulosus TaxID=6210 RepID=U6J7C6_ECHGR|nr:Helix-loop-helix protein 4 [Echinococcus granulosus]EUB62706.1 Helix-loop-helix protein 4 [Echinococcus granulosus]KAH9280588.1 Helix-loop-helix protein 4 [Echinococcus granulosus]CDS19222.1 Basic helix loop helix dimerisation region bHLH [Echinococcus granulosus]
MFQAWPALLQPQQAHIYHLHIDPRSDDGHEAVPMTSITEQNGAIEVERTEAALLAAEVRFRGEGRSSETENQRNERERRRVQQVNAAFALLRQHLPIQIGPYETTDRTRRAPARKRRSQRTSKVKILRAAIRYINELTGILQASEVVDNEQFV